MTLEQTIQYLYNDCPALFKERADCLDHLFCTIGNGYVWHNGQLICEDITDSEYIKYLESLFVDGKAYQHTKWSLRDEYIHNEYIEERYKNKDNGYTVEDRVRAILSVPDDVYYRVPERKQRWAVFLQGYTEYMLLKSVPDDVQPDWLKGVEECIELLNEDGYDLVTPIDVEANREEHYRNWNKQLRAHPTQEEIDDYIKSGKPLYIKREDSL